MCNNCEVYLPEELISVEIELLPEIENEFFLELFNYDNDNKIFEQLCLESNFNEELLIEISRDQLLQATVANGDNRSKKKIINNPVKYLALNNGYIRLQYECRGDPSLQYRHNQDLHNGYVDFKNQEIVEVFCSCRDFFYRVYYDMTKRFKLSKWRLTSRYKNKMLASVGAKYDNKRRHDKPIHYKDQGPFKWTNAEGKLFLCKHLYDAVNRFIGPEAKIPPLLGKKVIPGHRQQYLDQQKKAKEIQKNLANQKPTQIIPDTVKQVMVNPNIVQPKIDQQLQQGALDTSKAQNTTSVASNTPTANPISTKPIKTKSNTIKPK